MAALAAQLRGDVDAPATEAGARTMRRSYSSRQPKITRRGLLRSSSSAALSQCKTSRDLGENAGEWMDDAIVVTGDETSDPFVWQVGAKATSDSTVFLATPTENFKGATRYPIRRAASGILSRLSLQAAVSLGRVIGFGGAPWRGRWNSGT
jgi:hypothetical protein